MILSLKKKYKLVSLSKFESFINNSKWDNNKQVKEDILVLLNFENSVKKLFKKEPEDYYYFSFNSEKGIFLNLSIVKFDFQINQLSKSNFDLLIKHSNESFTIESRYYATFSNFEKLIK